MGKPSKDDVELEDSVCARELRQLSSVLDYSGNDCSTRCWVSARNSFISVSIGSAT